MPLSKSIPATIQVPAPAADAPAELLPFPVVGVGASAGGLEALLELLSALPAEPGMAFLFVLHLEPGRKSDLAEILGKASAMPVREAADGVPVEINHVYLIPPDSNIALDGGALTLSPRSPSRGQNMPADYLFRSLAAAQRGRAIGVILSGGGTDGTLGFEAIKAEGGITLAQDEHTAKHASMPRTAVTEGNVDYVLPPHDIAQQLLRLARHTPSLGDRPVGDGGGTPEADPSEGIILALRGTTGVDFTHYKRTTILRRIRRRMALRGIEEPAAYLELLRRDPEEQQSLYQDFLIRVTQFFRDPEAFEALKERALPALVQDRPPGSPIRIWVAGCATGEEAYSVAICLLEYLDGRPERFPIKILATDLSEAALTKARAGLYVDNIEIDVSAERLRRFFVRVGGQYQVSKAVRELCVFSRHNMTSDPPFSHLDLVSCRNLLIYMDAALQRRVLPMLHYALRPTGFLFLGGSESLGASADLFATVDAKHRLFSRKPSSGGATLDFGTFRAGEGVGRLPARDGGTPLWTALDVQREADRIVLARYAPVGVVIDETGTVVQFRGRTAAYLEPPAGMANLDLMRMLRDALLADVRSAFTQAKAENTAAARSGLRLTEAGREREVRVEVIPFKVPPSGVRFFVVLFQDTTPGEAPPASEPRPLADAQAAPLQQELAAVREYLQSVIEEQESTNEELKSANEEILSANEELQSTNEELQTAKEEAQSANEELSTVNDELRHRNLELGRVNSDLMNLMSGVNIPIVMVTRDLRVRRFTPLAAKLFNLIPGDVGRPISDIKSNLDVADLAGLIAGVIDGLTPYEGVVKDRSGDRYCLRIRPYVTLDNAIDGASVVVLDIESICNLGPADRGEK